MYFFFANLTTISFSIIILLHKAEFYNTLSNVFLFLPSLVALTQFHRTNLEVRFMMSYVGLAAVGLGSWAFHMTLRYNMQLMDELPMYMVGIIWLYYRV